MHSEYDYNSHSNKDCVTMIRSSFETVSNVFQKKKKQQQTIVSYWRFMTFQDSSCDKNETRQ